jgi:hypothetical protein
MTAITFAEIKDLSLDDRLDGLTQEMAIFVLKALVLAGHLTEHPVTKAIDLAETIRFK